MTRSPAPSTFRRRTLLLAGLAAAGAQAQTRPASPAQAPAIEVWTDPGCGCCKDWVAHLQSAGFAVKVNDGGHHAVRRKLGIADKHASCHTGVVAGYALEGHVPAREIRRLLAERPAGIGLAVPGMPVGSPGMDGADYGGRRDAFDVLLLAKDGSARVFQRYPAAAGKA